MPFHRYSPKTAKTLFKSTRSPSQPSQATPSQTPKTQNGERKTTSVAEALKDKFESTRALIASIQKERYDSDLERSRLGLKEAARAQIEAAQRAALDDELRNEALEELKRQELPAVIQRLEEELKPKVQEDLLVQLRADLEPKIHTELRMEMTEDVSQKVWTELREQLRDDVSEHLRMELQETLEESVRDQLYHELYPKVVAELKEEYRDMVLLQLKDELAADMATQGPGINGHADDVLDPALMAESETSDIEHPPSQMAVIAKRRFSEGFESDDPDTRAKKIKKVNPDVDPLATLEPLPLIDSFVSQRGALVKTVDESLDEGEKADVEDEPGNHLPDQQPEETLGQIVGKADEMAIPEDIHAEGDDELSQSDDEQRDAEQQSDQDADAEVETEIDGTGVTNRPDITQQSLSSQLSKSARGTRKLRSDSLSGVKANSPKPDIDEEPQPLHFLRKYSVKAGSQKLATTRKVSPPSRIPAKSQNQPKENNILHSEVGNDQEEEDEGEKSSPLSSVEDESELEAEDENETEDEEENEDENNKSNASSPDPWGSQNRPYHPMPDDEHLWLETQENPYSNSTNDGEEEENELEGYPDGSHYLGAAEDDEDDNEEEEDESDDPGLGTLPPHPIYSQGGRQDDPISLDSD